MTVSFVLSCIILYCYKYLIIRDHIGNKQDALCNMHYAIVFLFLLIIVTLNADVAFSIKC